MLRIRVGGRHCLDGHPARRKKIQPGQGRFLGRHRAVSPPGNLLLGSGVSAGDMVLAFCPAWIELTGFRAPVSIQRYNHAQHDPAHTADLPSKGSSWLPYELVNRNSNRLVYALYFGNLCRLIRLLSPKPLLACPEQCLSPISRRQCKDGHSCPSSLVTGRSARPTEKASFPAP